MSNPQESVLFSAYAEARSSEFYLAKQALQNFSSDIRKLSKNVHDAKELPDEYKFTTSPIEKNSFNHYMSINGAPVKLFDATAERDGTLTLNVLSDLTEKTPQYETKTFVANDKGRSPDLEIAMGAIIVGYVQQAEDLSLQETVQEQTVTKKSGYGMR